MDAAVHPDIHCSHQLLQEYSRRTPGSTDHPYVQVTFEERKLHHSPRFADVDQKSIVLLWWVRELLRWNHWELLKCPGHESLLRLSSLTFSIDQILVLPQEIKFGSSTRN
ncbi:hypothetical protein L2E82_50586 [Cichorium intybus]|nr:hypothetical protein L2E82_50586 [Cichorium intybus]